LAAQEADSREHSAQQSAANANIFCYVAREVYGPANPQWLLFRHWMFITSRLWFFRLYMRHGAEFAAWITDKPRLTGLLLS
jgi:hypothetical protein